jgi:ABC-type lipoprotein export system ATPase subunit
MIQAIDLGKSYPLPDGEVRVFRGLHFSVPAGEMTAVMGVSGVGKTTLLNLLGGLDRPSEGRVVLEGEDLGTKTIEQLAAIRNEKIGFVFQFFHLLPEFTALENVGLPLLIRGEDRSRAWSRARRLLGEVGLEEKAGMRPSQLSGGEQQRVSLARALVGAPRLLLADEPTGNLDSKTGESILRLIRELHDRMGLTSILVTHNERVAALCDRRLLMEKGRLKRLA